MTGAFERQLLRHLLGTTPADITPPPWITAAAAELAGIVTTFAVGLGVRPETAAAWFTQRLELTRETL